MEFEQSGLYQEFLAITATPNPVHYAYSAIIHLNEQSVDLTPMKLVQLDTNGDYEKNYGDEVMIRLLIPAGVYTFQIYPNQTNIDITVNRQPLMETGDTVNSAQPVQSQRYTAHLVDKGNPALAGNKRTTLSQDDMDRLNFLEVDFQLVDKGLEQARLKTVGGIYRGNTAADVIKNLLTQESTNISVGNQNPITGVQMVDADNTNVRDHVIIPHGTRLVDLPHYIQNKCGGVYGSGMGHYLQDGTWHVYPMYNPTRMSTAVSTCTIIVVPENKYPNLDRTYRIEGSNLVILATGEVKNTDSTTARQMNQGNGFRFADAMKMMEGFLLTSNNQSVASRGATNTEVLSVPRPNGMNNIQVSPNRITSNPYLEYSALAQKTGGNIGLVWENSDPTLIVPAMQCQVLYLADDQIQSQNGVILKAIHSVQMAAPGLTVARHVTRTALSIFTQSVLQGQQQQATTQMSATNPTTSLQNTVSQAIASLLPAGPTIMSSRPATPISS